MMNATPSTAESSSAEIRPLQYGRGIAALLVCIFHFEGAREQLHPQAAGAVGSIDLNYIFRAGHSGVEFFFILSGFIIFHAHRRDLGRPERLIGFYRKRAIRIFPMFWVILLPIGIAALAFSSSTALTPGKFLLDILLIPREGMLTLPTAWTLQHEMVFYILFGLMILNQRLGIAVLAFWQAACLIVLLWDLLPQDYALPSTTFWGYFNFGFMFGMLIAFLYERFDFRAHRRYLMVLGGVGFVGLLICFLGECRFGSAIFFPSPAASTLIYLGLYSLIIFALLAIANRPRPVLDATLGTLGAASYVLYLVHLPVASAIDKLCLLFPTLRPFAGSLSIYFLSIAVAVAISIAMHYAIERPVLMLLRKAVNSITARNAMTTSAAMPQGRS